MTFFKVSILFFNGLTLVFNVPSEVELKSTALRAPVEGLYVSFVEDTLTVLTVPDVASSNKTYLVAAVEVSSTIVTPPLLLP